ncbi:hypothetical protein PInf_018474 [Phytophthora infestans]|nr:hypothetical protein PInf_018474 [Phytophthora infestans]
MDEDVPQASIAFYSSPSMSSDLNLQPPHLPQPMLLRRVAAANGYPKLSMLARFCKTVGPTCKQCEAKIDPLLLNPQRSTTDFRSGYAFRTISGQDIVRRCIACENGPKAVEFWEEKSPPPDAAEVRRQESLANVKKAMGPDWYPKKKKRRSRPRQLPARNAKYIEQKKQQKSK